MKYVLLFSVAPSPLWTLTQSFVRMFGKTHCRKETLGQVNNKLGSLPLAGRNYILRNHRQFQFCDLRQKCFDLCQNHQEMAVFTYPSFTYSISLTNRRPQRLSVIFTG